MQVETAAVIRAMAPMIQLERDRIARLEERQVQLQSRLDLLAKARIGYETTDAKVKSKK